MIWHGFDEIIDVRSPAEYAEDRIPGAVNLPVLSDIEHAEIGKLYKTSPFAARLRGAGLLASNISAHLQNDYSSRPPEWRPLVYCRRGGQRSGAVVEILQRIGWKAQSLKGGYKQYRQEVITNTQKLAPTIQWTVVGGKTGAGKTELLRVLKDAGESVIDLEALGNHRGSAFGGNGAQPSQRLFESHLFAELSQLPPNRPVFVEAEGNLFYLYNNGISAICTEMIIGPEKVTCQDFQIINGAQTAWSIREFRELDSLEKIKKVKVLLRITETGTVQDQKKGTKGLNREMIEFNNTQNVIRDSDFRSNDPIQVILARKFQTEKIKYRASYPYHEIVYVPKRQDLTFKSSTPRSKTAGKIPVIMESLAKSLYVFKKDTPEKIHSETSFLFDEKDDDGYWSLFGDDNGKETEMVTPHKFKEFAAVAILYYFFEDKLKAEMKANDSDSIDGMIARAARLFLWAFGYIVREHYKKKGLEIKMYEKIINGDAFKSESGAKSVVDTLFAFIHEQFHLVLSNIEDKNELDNNNGHEEDSKPLNFRKWLRNAAKTKTLEKRMQYICKRKALPKI